MSEDTKLGSKEEYEKAIQAVDQVAKSVSKSEWNYDRLKAKREKLFLQAFIAYWKSISLKDDFLYPIRLTYSTYEYDCGMLNENLTRELLSLDGITSNGNEEIRQQRKAQVKRILDLQDKITDLHKAAAKLSVFYRSCLAQPRYQALLAQDSDIPEIQLPPSPIPEEINVEPEKSSEPKLQKQPSLMRKKSVHRITVLSPEEFEARKKGMEIEESIPKTEVETNQDLEKKRQEEALRKERERMEEEELSKLEEEERERMEEEELSKLEEARKREEDRKRKQEREQKKREEQKRLKEVPKPAQERDYSVNSIKSPDSQDLMEPMEPMEPVEPTEPNDSIESDEEDQPEVMEAEEDDEIESDYYPKYQWLQQGNQLLLMLMDVDFDQKSLRCITKPSKPTPKVIIQGYRIVKEHQPSGYYGLFYGSRPTYKYIPFTTVIPLPSVGVDLQKAPTAMYYDDQNILQIAYSIVPKHPKKKNPHQRQTRRPRREEPTYYVHNPFYPNRDMSAPYDPRYEDEDEDPAYYDNRYYRNPYSPYRQQRNGRPYSSSYASPFYPFFGGDMW